METHLQDFAFNPPTGTGGLPKAEVIPAPATHAPAPLPRDGSLIGRLAIAEWLLKHRDHLLHQIEEGRELPVILVDLLLVAALPTAFYGLVTGLATNSLVRIITNPLKLPLVLVFTLLLCLPALYIFSSFLGGKRSFLQTAALGFTSIAIVGVVLAAFAPITWFLTFTAPGAYPLHVLINVAILALSGFMGVAFLLAGARRLHAGNPRLRSQMGFMWAWIGLYGLVGSQMGWLLRPFFSAGGPWICAPQHHGETVFSAILTLLSHLLG
jgi:hypothetical protein